MYINARSAFLGLKDALTSLPISTWLLRNSTSNNLSWLSKLRKANFVLLDTNVTHSSKT